MTQAIERAGFHLDVVRRGNGPPTLGSELSAVIKMLKNRRQ